MCTTPPKNKTKKQKTSHFWVILSNNPSNSAVADSKCPYLTSCWTKRKPYYCLQICNLKINCVSPKHKHSCRKKILRNSLILVELGSYFVSSGHCLDNIAPSIFCDKIWGAIMQLLSTTIIIIITIHPCRAKKLISELSVTSVWSWTCCFPTSQQLWWVQCYRNHWKQWPKLLKSNHIV